MNELEIFRIPTAFLTDLRIDDFYAEAAAAEYFNILVDVNSTDYGKLQELIDVICRAGETVVAKARESGTKFLERTPINIAKNLKAIDELTERLGDALEREREFKKDTGAVYREAIDDLDEEIYCLEIEVAKSIENGIGNVNELNALIDQRHEEVDRFIKDIREIAELEDELRDLKEEGVRLSWDLKCEKEDLDRLEQDYAELLALRSNINELTLGGTANENLQNTISYY